MGTRVGLLAWVFLAGAVACQPQPPPAEPAVDPPPSTSTEEPAPKPAPTKPTTADLSGVPAFFRPMFVAGSSFRFHHRDAVDDHGPDGGRAASEQNLTCKVEPVSQLGAALVAQLSCVTADGAAFDPVVTSLSFVWSVEGKGLWMPAVTPASESAVNEVMAGKPLFHTTPQPGTREETRPGEEGDQPETCTHTTTLTRAQVCHEERCQVPMGYGDTLQRACFANGKGLVSLRAENIGGPRDTRYDRVY